MSRFFCHVVLICSGSMLGCVSTTIEPRTDPYDIALDQSDEPARSDLMYLMNHMSRSDLDGLGPERALHHAATMRQAWQEAPWADDIDESLWRAAILPPTHVSEACEDWCDTLHVRLDGIGTSSLTVRETVRQLNAAIGDTLGVHYHPTKRRAPDQGPLETIESGWSSCTGLSILLVRRCGSMTAETTPGSRYGLMGHGILWRPQIHRHGIPPGLRQRPLKQIRLTRCTAFMRSCQMDRTSFPCHGILSGRISAAKTSRPATSNAAAGRL
jgi:hypothetical protein